MTYTLANTFRDFYHWIKGELGDVMAMLEAIASKDRMIQNRNKLESKKKSSQNELDDLSVGKKTLKNLFKSATSKQNKILTLGQNIIKYDEDIEYLEKIIRMLEVNLAENIIPKFENKQVNSYYKFISFISKNEVNNCAALTKFWNDYMKNTTAS